MSKSLADTIKKAREKQGISQRELSRRTGIDNNTISEIEKGERKKPNAFSLKLLSMELNIDIKELMTICGYNDEQIEAMEEREEVIFAIRNMSDIRKMTESLDKKIKKLKKVIRLFEEAKKDPKNSDYKTLDENQINQLIELNRSILVGYIVERHALEQGFADNFEKGLKAFGIDVKEITYDDPDYDEYVNKKETE